MIGVCKCIPLHLAPVLDFSRARPVRQRELKRLEAGTRQEARKKLLTARKTVGVGVERVPGRQLLTRSTAEGLAVVATTGAAAAVGAVAAAATRLAAAALLLRNRLVVVACDAQY